MAFEVKRGLVTIHDVDASWKDLIHCTLFTFHLRSATLGPHRAFPSHRQWRQYPETNAG